LLEPTMAISIPLTMSQEAADFVAERGLEQTLQKMLDNLPQRIPGLRAIAVFLQPPYDVGGDACVILDVKRDIPAQDGDPTEWNWRRWVADNFPPREFQHFCLLSNYGPAHAG